jgi:hypothetical protein
MLVLVLVLVLVLLLLALLLFVVSFSTCQNSEIQPSVSAPRGKPDSGWSESFSGMLSTTAPLLPVSPPPLPPWWWCQ